MKQFQSKATLFADLVEHLLDEMREETVSYVRKFPYGLPRIMARVDHVWELYKKTKALATVEVMPGARGDPELSEQIGRAHVRTPIPNAHLVCRLLLEQKKN